MMKPEIELIERYIEGGLKPEEVELVRQLIKTDTTFHKEYKLRRDVNEAIKEKGIMQLRYKLNMIHQQEKTRSIGTVRHIFRLNWHLAAASITILIIVGSFLISKISTPEPDLLFDQYYTSDAIFTTRSGENNENINLTTGLQKFQKQEYTEAITLLKSISGNIVSNYYLGISYIETKQFHKAKLAFNAITEKESNLFTEQAEWYKGLCLLKLNELDNAKDLFASISTSNSIYNQNAAEILKKLN